MSLDLKAGGIDLDDFALVIDIDVNVARVVAHWELWNTVKLKISHYLPGGHIDHCYGLAGLLAYKDSSRDLGVDHTVGIGRGPVIVEMRMCRSEGQCGADNLAGDPDDMFPQHVFESS